MTGIIPGTRNHRVHYEEVDGLVVALRFKNTSTQSDTVSKIEQTLLMTQNFENLNESA